MGQQKDKKNLKDLEMAKKRDHKIMITDEAIRKYQEYNIKIYREKNTIRFRNWQEMFCVFRKMKIILMKWR